ncbi:zinc finger RNA-binding protein-like [Lepeophtheirus salmonis]|uniref:zinc finger RNA-binding protein-like n=1 Tax=Lepeophtheirus salmonis TaxID=72036 RepID=UPI003AF33E42
MSVVTGAANPLDYLFKLSTQRKLPAPVFNQVVEDGPPHMKTFVWRCTFMQITAEGKGRSKKEAKTAAARAIKDSLNPDNLPPEAPSGNNRKRKTDKNNSSNANNNSDSSALIQDHNNTSTTQSLNKKRKKGTSFSKKHGAHGMFSPVMPPFAPVQPYVQSFGFRGKMSVDDHYVITKHKNIYPKDDELEYILKLVTQVEESLRSCSDALAEINAKEAKGCKEVSEEDKEEYRDILGVARIGDLAKGLLLSSDRSVDLVIMCKEMPTIDDLLKLSNAMTLKLKELDSPNAYKIVVSEEEAGFKVSYSPSKEGEDEVEVDDEGGEERTSYITKVTLTSSKVKSPEKETTAEEDVMNGVQTEEKEYLNNLKVETALIELRRSNWFASMASGLPSCVECIRIIKEMSRRDPSWSCLSNWLIELLVERSLFSAHQPLSPASSLLRVLEVISSGIFLNGGSGLKDPCEKEDTDVSEYLTPQQREDLTHSAQYFIRLITYRQINKVLGMEKLPPKGKHKAQNKNGSSGGGGGGAAAAAVEAPATPTASETSTA